MYRFEGAKDFTSVCACRLVAYATHRLDAYCHMILTTRGACSLTLSLQQCGLGPESGSILASVLGSPDVHVEQLLLADNNLSSSGFTAIGTCSIVSASELHLPRAQSLRICTPVSGSTCAQHKALCAGRGEQRHWGRRHSVAPGCQMRAKFTSVWQ